MKIKVGDIVVKEYNRNVYDQLLEGNLIIGRVTKIHNKFSGNKEYEVDIVYNKLGTWKHDLIDPTWNCKRFEKIDKDISIEDWLMVDEI